MKKTMVNILLLLIAGLVVVCCIWGPERLAKYKDTAILDKINILEVETEGEGYRYQLSNSEKLYILSECLNSQTMPESEQSALTRDESAEAGYGTTEGTYAFVVNHRETEEKEITDEEIFEICNVQLEQLKELGIIPEAVKDTQNTAYDAVLYSAIDVLEPRNNVAVWKVSLANSQKNANKSNRLIDAYIDGDTGRLYEFYVRTQITSWEEINPDEIIEKWAGYMGLSKPVVYETDNPLMETTPYYKKYVFESTGGERTIVTVGYYEGIGELFLKISR